MAIQEIPFSYQPQSHTAMVDASAKFYTAMRTRRSVRHFSNQPVPEQVIRNALLAAGTAPSGANLQPWHFAITTDPEVKSRLRALAEEEERNFYNHRASDEWLQALAPLGTDADKPFLEVAPVLIGVFQQKFHFDAAGNKHKHYYPAESTGLACGLLISALHQSGLATLTHTPSPMKFMNDIFQRPKTEKAFLLLVVGYPAANCRVPDIKRKSLDEFTSTVGAVTPALS
ncbi:MAG TPA: nitroreductase family protein [Gammaproteobacteria bacterium]|nr:nitroreductase family protein [Gammaproteobacteria bacterium]HBK12669.1 nitroreductase family protein [Gammaproteobacteria bacterium]|tara:strand:+ start:4690 stop:5376 length:687 start_codon:yes stop_codon:yes gene_type:complete